MNSKTISNIPKVVIIGDINIDLVINVENLDKLVQESSLEKKDCISSKLGGGGLIFAIAAKNVGFESYLIGRVGKDQFGNFAKENLKQNGISLSISYDSNADTGKVIIIRDVNDKRVLISHRGANVNLRPDELDVEIIKKCNLLYISGYTFLEAPQSKASLKAMKIAKSEGVFSTLDVVPHRIFASGVGDDYMEGLSLADGVVLEIGTARRMLNNFTDSEQILIQKLLETYKLVILSIDNDNQTIASKTKIEKIATGYSNAMNKVGHLDKHYAKILFDFITEKTVV